MKILVLGGDVTALVAGFAAVTHRPDAELAILSSPGPTGFGISVFPPTNNEIMPAVIPPLLDIAMVREITVIGSGSPADWPEKVGGRPDRMVEYFPLKPREQIRVHTQKDVYEALVTTRLAYSLQAWMPDEHPLAQVVETTTPDLIINTMPRRVFCEKPYEHGFDRRPIWVSYKVGPNDLAEDQIILNSEDAPAWFSSSKFDGTQVTKWVGAKPPFSSIVEDSAPISTNCDCTPHGMVHIGVEAQCNPTLSLVEVFSDSVAAVMQAQGV